MRLILDSITRAGQRPDREAVRQAAFTTRNRSSVLGTYSIDPNGDTTLTNYGLYAIQRGALTFQRTLQIEAH
jgi:branched-chain amino acid transport system substrate-binding protein